MKGKKALTGIVIFVLMMIFVSCSQDDVVQKEDRNPTGKQIQIGMTFDSFVIERWQRDRDIFVSAAKELGAEVNVQNANGDAKEQISQIEYFIQKEMDVIVIIAVDSKGLTDVVKKARKNGIKVIAYDRLLNDAGADLYISFDNEQVGQFMAETIRDAMPDGGKIVMIQGPTTDNNVSLVYQGFMSVLNNTEIEVAHETNCEGWRAEEAFEFLDGCDDLEQIQGVMCGNDSLAGQTIRALSMHRLAGSVTVVGQDAELEACQRIVEDTQAMTVYKQIEKLAVKAAQCAVALAKNEKLQDANTILDGSSLIPYVKIEPIRVTKDNIDEIIIDGGFHLKEDVYLNVEETIK